MAGQRPVSTATIVIMAAGIGSRYGGLKQIEPVGPNGESLLAYTLDDALAGGFGKVVFIIRKEIEPIFRDAIGRQIEARVPTTYVHQELDRLPVGCSVPGGRAKPLGTGHAVLCCADTIADPFAVVNADDFYGRGAFEILYEVLAQPRLMKCEPPELAMVGYRLENTLSPHGPVARGVCAVSTDGYLEGIEELTSIERTGDRVISTQAGNVRRLLDPNAIVSLNLWGLTPAIFPELERRFRRFLETAAADPKAEFYLSEAIGDMIRQGRARVKVLPTDETWYGLTYPADKAVLEEALRALAAEGVYPSKWGFGMQG